MSTLPKVATNFLHYCKKCDHERYHKVLAHTTSTSAKVECEVCNSKKTYKLNEGKSVAKKPRKTKAEAAAQVLNAKYQELLEKFGTEKAQPYRMTNVYAADVAIEHPKFGVGFVIASLPNKIEVVFQDSSRQLVQGRK